ncbi:hypothetical protein AQUCO_07000027v1 [Aquilegia coerulea]|uniref:AAA+ ATPase domain-containing protein n=1 Tax=Aquilegia coerulea TaxID=218851 RepID=A0A2G5CAX6_AQUCA|nr:hypothetical protein AQUCO_07000027v1 [Aquilegia coerulea]
MSELLVSILLGKLGSVVFDGVDQEIGVLVGIKSEIKRLTKTLTIIQGVLEDAEEKQVKNKAVKLWLEDFKNISYDAEDILDEWSTRSMIRTSSQPNPNASISKKIPFQLFELFTCFKPIVVRHDIGIKMKGLNKRLDEIARKKELYNLNEIQRNEKHRPLTSAFADVSQIYGRVVDKDAIVNKLWDESTHHDSHVPVISIVGTGGFGKTALAQLILKETKVLTSFEKQMWVCVSDPLDLEKVAKQIIEEANGNVPATIGWHALLKNLSKAIQGKRYILVLDDVWSYNGDQWSQLKQALDCGAMGSRILITTRNEMVAMKMDSSYRHMLGQLRDDDCWTLFRSIAFMGREDDLDKFKDIGEEISKKCKGVPLEVKVLASLMRFKRTRQEWRNVLESNLWEGGEGFLPSILFSYYALPSYLKPCLMYCAVLPKDAYIEKEEMVRLWMAQGYLGSTGSADLEMIGRDYFDNLAMLSFFQDFERDSEGNITSCKMHDLVHDFVQFLTKTETIILEEQMGSSTNVRHLCARDLYGSSICEQKNLRTLRPIHGSSLNSTVALELLHQLKCLRVLSLRHCHIKELPSKVERLLHLRYLDLSYNSELEELPEAVCNLPNLQTLNLSSCGHLKRLPEGIGKLSNLRHLHIKGCPSLAYLPRGIGKLMCLRTLEEFIVGVRESGDEVSKEIGCKIEELQLLNHLQGHLLIRELRQVADVSNVEQAELKMKEKLFSLKLHFGFEDEEKEDVIRMEGILEGIKPHTNLEKLEIEYYRGIRLPEWISSLSNLTELSLVHLHQCLQLPALGKLVSLECLKLKWLPTLKRLGCEFYGLDTLHSNGSVQRRHSSSSSSSRKW